PRQRTSPARRRGRLRCCGARSNVKARSTRRKEPQRAQSTQRDHQLFCFVVFVSFVVQAIGRRVSQAFSSDRVARANPRGLSSMREPYGSIVVAEPNANAIAAGRPDVVAG